MRIAARSIQCQLAIATETSDARQPQPSVSHHHRGGRARLQSLPDQEGTGGPADQCRPERTEDPEQVRQAVPPIMKSPDIKLLWLLLLGGLGLLTLATSAMADRGSREQDIV